MADWTTIPDSSIEPGKPIRSIDGLALRDNPVAIAEGAVGAPRVVSAARPQAKIAEAITTVPLIVLALTNIPAHHAISLSLSATFSGTAVYAVQISNNNGATWVNCVSETFPTTTKMKVLIFSETSGPTLCTSINTFAIDFAGPINAVRIVQTSGVGSFQAGSRFTVHGLFMGIN
jgi:hypothetical protein